MHEVLLSARDSQLEDTTVARWYQTNSGYKETQQAVEKLFNSMGAPPPIRWHFYRRVVQLANTLACHARDHGFEPRHGDHGR